METAEMYPLHQKWISYGGLQNATQTSNTTYFQVIDGSQLVQHREKTDVHNRTTSVTQLLISFHLFLQRWKSARKCRII